MTLKKVDIVAPSGNVLNLDEITRTAALFIARDWKVELGTTIYSSHQRFAGETDRQRLNDFNYACTLATTIGFSRPRWLRNEPPPSLY